MLWAGEIPHGPLSGVADGFDGRRDACGCRIPAAGAAVTVRATRNVDQDRARAGATGVDGKKHRRMSQFGLIGCAKDR